MRAETSGAEGRRIYMLCRTCGYMLEPLDKLCPPGVRPSVACVAGIR